MLIDIVKAASGYVTAVSIVALVAVLFSYVINNLKVRSMRSQIIGDTPGADKVVDVLRTFQDDESKLKALKEILNDDSRKAATLLARARQFDPQLHQKRQEASRLALCAIIGVIFLLIGVIGIFARAEDTTQRRPLEPLHDTSACWDETVECLRELKAQECERKQKECEARAPHRPSGPR